MKDYKIGVNLPGLEADIYVPEDVLPSPIEVASTDEERRVLRASVQRLVRGSLEGLEYGEWDRDAATPRPQSSEANGQLRRAAFRYQNPQASFVSRIGVAVGSAEDGDTLEHETVLLDSDGSGYTVNIRRAVVDARSLRTSAVTVHVDRHPSGLGPLDVEPSPLPTPRDWQQGVDVVLHDEGQAPRRRGRLRRNPR